MNRVAGKVAFITGAARGQGRSHAVRLAEEGADIIAVDLCVDIPEVAYSMGTDEDLAETVALVEKLDRRIVSMKADVRDQAQVDKAVTAGMETFGKIDIVVANAGITGFGAAWELSEEAWAQMLDVNLSGVWRTTKATIPHLIERGQGGSIILTSSVAGLVSASETPDRVDQHRTFAEAADILTALTGRKVTYHAETIEEAYASRAVYGAPDWQVDAWVSTYTAIANGEMAGVSSTVPDITGHPARSLEDLLRQRD